MESALYDRIGKGYNTTRTADPYLSDRLFHLLQADPSKKYLDIGSGTGNYTIALAERGLTITGLDPSDQMLEIARSRSSNVQWEKGTVEAIPFADVSFGGIYGTLTMHHWNNLEQGFRELFRVAQPGSNMVFLTSTPEQMEGYWLNHYFPVMMQKSIEMMPSEERVTAAMHAAGFSVTGSEKYFVQDDLKDHFLHVGKNAPELYFDENIRKGISTFANLANREEVELGLDALRFDLDNGTFNGVKRQYDSNLGDYLFITASKN